MNQQKKVTPGNVSMGAIVGRTIVNTVVGMTVAAAFTEVGKCLATRFEKFYDKWDKEEIRQRNRKIETSDQILVDNFYQANHEREFHLTTVKKIADGMIHDYTNLSINPDHLVEDPTIKTMHTVSVDALNSIISQLKKDTTANYALVKPITRTYTHSQGLVIRLTKRDETDQSTTTRLQRSDYFLPWDVVSDRIYDILMTVDGMSTAAKYYKAIKRFPAIYLLEVDPVI